MGMPQSRLATTCESASHWRAILRSLMIASATVVAGGALAAQPAGAATLPSPAGLADSTIPSLPSPKCAGPGETAVRATAAGKTADGGFVYDFTIAGKLNEVRVPPASFKPLTASDAQLAEYGFEPRPTDSAALAHWTAIFAGFKGVPLPEFCLTAKHNEAVRASGGTTTRPPKTGHSDPSNSNNWGGVAAYSSAGWVAVEGEWVQSQAGNCYCGTSDTEESTWTGIGGYGNPALIQQGTDMQGTPSYIFPWYEYLHCGNTPGCQDPPEIQMYGFSIAAGTPVYAYTAYQSSNGQTDFLVCNQGYCRSVLVTLDGSYYDPLYADYIDERPSFCAGGCYKPLTNFQYNNWYNGYSENTSGGWQGLDTVPAWAVTMVNGSNQTLVAQTAFGSLDTFTDSWFQAQ